MVVWHSTSEWYAGEVEISQVHQRAHKIWYLATRASKVVHAEIKVDQFIQREVSKKVYPARAQGMTYLADQRCVSEKIIRVQV